MRWVSRLTTIAVVIAAVAGFALWVRGRVPSAEIEGSFRTYAMFRDGSRLAERLAGGDRGRADRRHHAARRSRGGSRASTWCCATTSQIPVGLVRHPARRLAVRRQLRRDHPGRRATRARPRCGCSARASRIVHVIEGGSTDTVLRAIDRTMPRIDNALERAPRAHARRPQVGQRRDGRERPSEADRWLARGPHRAADPVRAPGGPDPRAADHARRGGPVRDRPRGRPDAAPTRRRAGRRAARAWRTPRPRS